MLKISSLYIILLTLIIYSAIATIIIEVIHENDDVIAVFGFGIVGCSLAIVGKIIRKIHKYFKYYYGKRSIFVEENTGNKYKCKIKDSNDIQYWTSGYKLITRYANKLEWESIPDFDNDFIENSKRNCDNCKYDKQCQCNFPYDQIKCKHDNYGTVLKFDKFEKS